MSKSKLPTLLVVGTGMGLLLVAGGAVLWFRAWSQIVDYAGRPSPSHESPPPPAARADRPRPAPPRQAPSLPASTQAASSPAADEQRERATRAAAWGQRLHQRLEERGMVAATHDPDFGDPFTPQDDKPAQVRTLAQEGAFRLGVTQDATMRDEAKVTAILQELGAEIDRLDRGRSDHFEARLHDYQPVIDRYRERLAEQMTGGFGLKGNGWSMVLSTARPEGRGHEE